MFKWFRYLSIRSKLIWLVLAMFTIPWMGTRYVTEMKEFLLQGQKDALLLTAGGIATILNDRTELFELDAGVPELLGEKSDSFAYLLPRLIQLDGDSSDWGNIALREKRGFTEGGMSQCDADYIPGNLALQHLLGYRSNWLYALFEVTDDQIIYRDLERRKLGNGDHIRVLIQHPYGPLTRYTMVARAPGRMTAYLASGDWQSPLLGDPVEDVVAVLKETEYGYAVELRLPRYLVGRYSRLGFSIIDVDDPETRELRAQISTYPQAENTQPGRVLLTSPEITQLLRGLNQPNSRIWVIDKQQQVRAVVGGLTPPRAVEEPGEAPVTQWQKLQNRMSTRLDALLRRPDVVFEDLPSDITVRRDEMIVDVLGGEPKSDTRRSVDKKVKIVMAGHPIREGNSVLGMVMVEQSSHAILRSQYELLKSLAASSLLVFVFITLALIVFAWRLTVRIGRLHDATEKAITPEGRVQDSNIPTRVYPRDELGDLGRSITSMLRRLSGYTHYLEGLPDTLAHEMNNPLNVVSSSLQILEQEQESIRGNKYMERAQGGIQRLRHLLSSLTQAANLEEAMRSEEKRRLNLARLLRDYIEGAQATFSLHRFKLSLQYKDMYILGSGDHIAELLDKLIDNAVQFGVPQTTIEVSLVAREEGLLLTVANEGATIEEGQHERVFDPMVSLGRKDAQTSHLGLGLYVVRLIADYHQARTWMANRYDGTGVVVSVLFPLMME
ncbi:MAG: HAMP domain-containing protein [Proteobacteria bacterium]|nr:HAMP domain-containing protein [Pseudomonadota bacterium]